VSDTWEVTLGQTVHFSDDLQLGPNIGDLFSKTFLCGKNPDEGRSRMEVV
jgi:hypothetical protein